MVNLANYKRFLLHWQPSGAGLAWLVSLGWWLVLSWPLRRNLRSALGGTACYPCGGPPTKPRRPKDRLRNSPSHLAYPSAA